MAELQPSIRNLLLDQDQGGAAGRLRRAREALLQAGTAPEVIEQIGLENATLALGQALSQAGLEQAAQRCCDLAASFGPGSASTPASLTELNSWVYPRSLRRYQLAILNKQALNVELAGASFELRGCRADPDRNHLLLQQRDNASLWWLSSNECADGYLLSASSLRPAEPGPDSDGLNKQEPVLVRAGNSNFAHFLWNELDPLLRLIDASHSLAVVQDTDTVLNLAQLDGISRVEPALLNSHQSVRLGGTLVTGKARQTVMPHSTLSGEANLLVLPDIDAANISYNLLKTAAGGNIAIGPVLLGAAKPVHILTASTTVRRIVNMTALTIADANASR